MNDFNFFPEKSKKIAVGLSGGVDSSVAAVRLVKMGYQMVGFWMWLVNEDSLGRLGRVSRFSSPRIARRKKTDVSIISSALANIRGQRKFDTLPAPSCILSAKICQFLKIPFYVVDLRKEFKKEVINYFLEEYKNGRTPNPCIVCNQKIKFGRMLKIAIEKLKADYLATGHYARIVVNKSGIFRLLNGVDKNKDQSYFLYTLDKKKLSKIVFPNGSFFKKETRELAKKWQLPTKDVAESENICFIKNFNKNKTYKDNLQNFLSKNLKPKSGLVIDTKGNVLGTHKGLCFYTIGSRGGWRMEIKKSKIKNQNDKLKFKKNNLIGGDRVRLYTVKINSKNNQLVVGTKSEASKKEFEVEQVNWSDKSFRNCFIKIRSAGKFLKAKLKKDKKSIKVFLEKPELGIAPGQRAVFYQPFDSDSYEVIGGGVISHGKGFLNN